MSRKLTDIERLAVITALEEREATLRTTATEAMELNPESVVDALIRAADEVEELCNAFKSGEVG